MVGLLFCTFVHAHIQMDGNKSQWFILLKQDFIEMFRICLSKMPNILSIHRYDLCLLNVIDQCFQPVCCQTYSDQIYSKLLKENSSEIFRISNVK